MRTPISKGILLNFFLLSFEEVLRGVSSMIIHVPSYSSKALSSGGGKERTIYLLLICNGYNTIDLQERFDIVNTR